MDRLSKLLLAGCCCALCWAAPAYASTNLETSSALAGISVAMNNYYASNQEPEKTMAAALSAVDGPVIVANAASEAPKESQAPAALETPKETAAPQAAASPNGSVAVAKVSGAVNIRSEASTSGAVLGKIYNNNAATILDTVDGEGGKWYKIQSGSVTGYIKAEYFVTGQAAEEQAQSIGATYGTVVGTPTLRLRESPDLTSRTLTLLAEGAQYVVVGEQGDFLKVEVDSDLVGYVYKEYMTTSVQLPEAVSNEEEKEQQEAEEKRKQEAQAAIEELEQVKESERHKAPETEKETEKPTSAASGTIAANPEKDNETTAAAPTTAKPTEPAADAKEPGNDGAVEKATRNAVVAYAKQFLGNPYLYGGTSLTEGADCSGFVMSVYAHFGISTGRSSRDQAGHGTEISVDSVQPGDLLFYASGGYINHVAIYIGGGQIIHASNPTTGICLAPANYRTPCKAVTFFN